MSHRLHLLMEYPDNKNTVLTPPVKNGVSLVIVTANPNCNLLALMPHEWSGGEEAIGALQVIGVNIGLESTKVKQGIFVDGSEILRRKYLSLRDIAAADIGRVIRHKRREVGAQQETAAGLAGVGTKFLSQLETARRRQSWARFFRCSRRWGWRSTFSPAPKTR